MVEALLECGADPHGVVRRSGYTALHEAAARGFDTCLRILLRHGADINLSHDGFPSPLIAAATVRNPNCLRTLLGSGTVDIDFVDKFGENALLEAAMRGYDANVEILLQRGADVNFRSKGQFSEGKTALHFAAAKGSPETIKVLIAHNVDKDSMDARGRTALSYASEKGKLFSTAELCSSGCSLNLSDSAGSTPLMWATARSQLNVVKCLLHAGAGSNLRNFLGTSAYSFASNLTSEKWSIKKILYVSGAVSTDLSDRTWTQILEQRSQATPDNHLTERDVDTVTESLSATPRVPSLMQESRVAVRKCMSEARPESNHFHLVPKLPLPPAVKDYLLFGLVFSIPMEEERTLS